MQRRLLTDHFSGRVEQSVGCVCVCVCVFECPDNKFQTKLPFWVDIWQIGSS